MPRQQIDVMLFVANNRALTADSIRRRLGIAIGGIYNVLRRLEDAEIVMRVGVIDDVPGKPRPRYAVTKYGNEIAGIYRMADKLADDSWTIYGTSRR